MVNSLKEKDADEAWFTLFKELGLMLYGFILCLVLIAGTLLVTVAILKWAYGVVFH